MGRGIEAVSDEGGERCGWEDGEDAGGGVHCGHPAGIQSVELLCRAARGELP